MISTARMKDQDEPTTSEVADANLRKNSFIHSLLDEEAASRNRRACLSRRADTPVFTSVQIRRRAQNILCQVRLNQLPVFFAPLAVASFASSALSATLCPAAFVPCAATFAPLAV